MNCQICYLSPLGHAKELAAAFKPVFPSRTAVIDLNREGPSPSDVSLIGFEFPYSAADGIPDELAGCLAELKSSEVLLFATCPVIVNERSRRSVEMYIKTLLPPGCKFHGLYICRGAVYYTVIQALELQRKQDPENQQIQSLLSQYRISERHPNRNDVRNGLRFISNTLDLNGF